MSSSCTVCLMFLFASILATFVVVVGGEASDPCDHDKVVDLMIDAIKKLEKEVDELKEENKKLGGAVEDLETAVADLTKDEHITGATFVRWGRNVCKANTTRLYKGYAGGAPYTDGGSGSNFLCLPEEPQWKNYYGSSYQEGRITGAEYQSIDTKIFSTHNNGGHSLTGNPAPCAVCLAAGRSTVLMIPAKTQCPDGWTTEYAGYLAASYTSHQKSTYICVDEAPEVATGGFNKNQALLSQVEVGCGTLPCSRYISGRQLACLVCSK